MLIQDEQWQRFVFKMGIINVTKYSGNDNPNSCILCIILSAMYAGSLYQYTLFLTCWKPQIHRNFVPGQNLCIYFSKKMRLPGAFLTKIDA